MFISDSIKHLIRNSTTSENQQYTIICHDTPNCIGILYLESQSKFFSDPSRTYILLENMKRSSVHGSAKIFLNDLNVNNIEETGRIIGQSFLSFLSIIKLLFSRMYIQFIYNFRKIQKIHQIYSKEHEAKQETSKDQKENIKSERNFLVPRRR